MKKTVYLTIFIILIFFSNNALGLQQVAGPLELTVPIGKTNETTWSLFNDGNEIITVKLMSDGYVSKYLSFPETVNLEPKQFTPITITASVPNNYDKSLGGKLYGYLYALQEGKSGQVQVNVQMKKSISILVPGLPIVDLTTTTLPIKESVKTTNQESNSNTPTGFLVLSPSFSLSQYLLPIGILLVLVVGIAGGLFLSKFKIERR